MYLQWNTCHKSLRYLGTKIWKSAPAHLKNSDLYRPMYKNVTECHCILRTTRTPKRYRRFCFLLFWFFIFSHSNVFVLQDSFKLTLPFKRKQTSISSSYLYNKNFWLQRLTYQSGINAILSNSITNASGIKSRTPLSHWLWTCFSNYCVIATNSTRLACH